MFDPPSVVALVPRVELDVIHAREPSHRSNVRQLSRVASAPPDPASTQEHGKRKFAAQSSVGPIGPATWIDLPWNGQASPRRRSPDGRARLGALPNATRTGRERLVHPGRGDRAVIEA